MDRKRGILFAGVACLAFAAALPAAAQNASDQASFETAISGGSVNVTTSTLNVTNPAATTSTFATVNLNGNTLGLTGLGGTGGLDVSNGGFLNLTGTNSFTGNLRGTSITIIADNNAALGGGTLILNGATFTAAADFNNSHAISLTGPGATIDSNGHALTLSGVISGTGTVFYVTGGGTVTVTGANTFSGQVTADATTLSIQNAGALGAGASAIALKNGGVLRTTANMALSRNLTLTSGGALDVAAGTTLAASGVISGDTLAKTGAGTLVLSGANAYTGTTTISGGTLQVGNGATGSLGSGAVVNNAALKFSHNSTVTIANAISGTGSVTFAGVTYILTGANAYSGVTTIGTGILQVGAGGTTGSLGTGNVVDNFSLNFNRSDTITVANAISGDGGVGQVGTGKVILTGANTYLGGTYIGSGILQVGDGGTTGALGGDPVTNNGALVFDRSDALTVPNVISGTGSVTQNGLGKLILNGVNTYTGGTTVNSGELQIGDASNPGASIAGAVTVNSGATLSGHGSIGGDVTNDGVVSPGGSVGTLTIAGNYISHSGSQLLIQVTPTGASLLKIGGAATLAGGLGLVYAPGVYSAAVLPIVQAGSLTGTFASVTESGSVPTALTRTVGYSATGASLTLAGPTTSTTDPTSPSTPPVVVGPADDALFGSAQTVLANGGHSALGLLLDRKADPADETCVTPGAGAPQGADGLCRQGGWTRAFGQFSSVNGLAGNPGFTSRGGGFLAGVGRPLQGGTIGVAGGYQRSDLSDSGGGRAQADSVRLDGYAARAYGPTVLTAAVGYAWNHVGSQRDAGPFKATATYDVHEIDGGLQAAAPVRVGAVTLTPKAGLRYVELLQNGFTEKAPGDFGVSVHAQNLDSLQPFLGADLSSAQEWQGGTLTPELRLGVRHELLDTARRTEVRSATGFDFLAASTTLGRDVASAGAGVTFLRGDRAAISARYDADFAREIVTQTVSVGAHLRF